MKTQASRSIVMDFSMMQWLPINSSTQHYCFFNYMLCWYEKNASEISHSDMATGGGTLLLHVSSSEKCLYWVCSRAESCDTLNWVKRMAKGQWRGAVVPGAAAEPFCQFPVWNSSTQSHSINVAPWRRHFTIGIPPHYMYHLLWVRSPCWLHGQTIFIAPLAQYNAMTRRYSILSAIQLATVLYTLQLVSFPFFHKFCQNVDW